MTSPTPLTIHRYSTLSVTQRQKLMARAEESYTDIASDVNALIAQVKNVGDAAISRRYRSLWGDDYKGIRVSPAEVQRAYAQVSPALVKAFRQMISHITAVHESQLLVKQERITVPAPGIRVWREWRAIDRVGLYIPGGDAVYPSSVFMSAIPARIAGCREIVVTTRPSDTGELPPAIIVACDMMGITEIYRVGGPLAIAALAYGTESVQPVAKIVGAGNRYVTAAKLAVYGRVDIDGPAGPSEIMVIADETANPDFIAADLMADGEHSGDNACVLVTTSKLLANRVQTSLEKLMLTVATSDRIHRSFGSYSYCLIVNDMDEAISFANEYAPEHLTIMTNQPYAIAQKIRHAGSVFLGSFTSKSSGDYATGANHVLPTGGAARAFRPLGVDQYGKWMQFQECTQEGLRSIRETIGILADTEALPAHRLSTDIRFR